MSEIAIPVENLSKLYHLGAVHQRPDTTSTVLSASLRDALTGFLPRITRISRISRKGKDNSPNSLNSRQASQVNSSNSPNSWQASGSPDDLWALKDISFEACPAPPGCYAKCNRRVKRGEVVGTPALASGASVIGRNGAGKSTLLKILSRSRAHQRPGRDLRRPGRLAAGGRHRLAWRPRADRPREHPLCVNGATLCVGMHRHEIQRRFDETCAEPVEASWPLPRLVLSPVEVSSASWTPPSRRRIAYSGTPKRVRLAFAVAAHLEPEILLVDESLS